MNAIGRRSAVPGRIGLLAALAIYLFHVSLYFRHINDDAFITFRYSRFLADGLGPFFNAGEQVEGYTNFLQMVLMSAVYAIGGEGAVLPASRILGIVWGALALVLVYRVCRTLASRFDLPDATGRVSGGMAACLVACFPGYAVNSTSGLETTLYAVLVILGAWLGVRTVLEGRWRGSGPVWAAAALTRPEGVVVFGLFWTASVAVCLLFRETGTSTGKRRTVPGAFWIDLALVAAILGGHLLFRYLAYDGELLPNTYHAKIQGHLGISPWEYISRGALAPFLWIPGVLLGLAGWFRGGRGAGACLPIPAVALFGACLPLLVGSDWMPGWRFTVPYLPLLASVVVIGWALLLRRAHVGMPALLPVLLLAVVAVQGALHQGERRELMDLVRLRAEGYRTGHFTMARWLREEACKPGDTVALMDIGIVGFHCPQQRILDITGLTDRFIAKSPGPFLQKEYDPAYVLDREPRVIVIVFSTYSDPGSPPSDDSRLGTWIRNESRILAHPSFREHYVHERIADPGTPGWRERFAARVGADRIFEHAHPGQHYILAAFLRKDVQSAGVSESLERASSRRVLALSATDPSPATDR